MIPAPPGYEWKKVSSTRCILCDAMMVFCVLYELGLGIWLLKDVVP